MVPSDAHKSNLTVDGTLLVKGQLVVAKVQTGELSVISPNTAKIKDAIVDDLTIVGNLYLPTSGGTASSLNFYQEFTGTVNFTSDSFAGTLSSGVRLTRIGNVVTMMLQEASTLGNGTVGALQSSAIPAQFQPAELFIIPGVTAIDNNVECAAFLRFQSGGTFTVQVGINGVFLPNKLSPFAWTGSGMVGIKAVAMSWIAA